MRMSHLVLLATTSIVAAACASDTGGTTNPKQSLAYIRYVNAIADTGVVDVRAVDKVENLYLNSVPYRFVGQYIGVAPGDRHFKVFANAGSTDINQVSQVLVDTTVSLTAGQYYTILHTGFARTGSSPRQHWVVVPETKPTVAAGKFAMRAMVALGGDGPIDVYTPVDTGDANPAAAVVSNVDFGTPSAFVPVDTTAKLVARATVSAAATRLAQTRLPAGAPAQLQLDPAAGVSQSGSAMTVFYFPAGLGQAAGAASVGYGIDVRPPRP